MAVQGQPKEKMCPQCFEINPEASTFCQLCGASLAEGKAASEGSDVEVYKELAQTNLLRMRGQYKDAIQVCLGILKKYPNNATAHTLLGDVHVEMNELAQAAEWYEMALDLSPNSDADKQKLALVRRRIQEREKAQTAEQIGLADSSRPAPGLYIALAATAILVVGGGSFFLGQMVTQKPKPSVTHPVTVGESSKPKPVDEGEKPVTSPSGQPDGGDQTPQEPAPTGTSQPASPDRTTLEFLKARGTASSTLYSVLEDPRTKHLTLSAELPAGGDTVLTAAKLAADAFTLVPLVEKVSIKLVQSGTATFMADATRADYEAAIGSLSDGQTIGDAAGSFLTNTWPAAQ